MSSKETEKIISGRTLRRAGGMGIFLVTNKQGMLIRHLRVFFFLDRCRCRQYDSVASLVASEPELRGTELSEGRAGHIF